MGRKGKIIFAEDMSGGEFTAPTGYEDFCLELSLSKIIETVAPISAVSYSFFFYVLMQE